VLIPDDVIPLLPLRPSERDALTVVASGYTFAFDRFAPEGDLGMVAPRMLGPEVRSSDGARTTISTSRGRRAISPPRSPRDGSPRMGSRARRRPPRLAAL